MSMRRDGGGGVCGERTKVEETTKIEGRDRSSTRPGRRNH